MRTTHLAATALGLATLTAAIGGGVAVAAANTHTASGPTVVRYYETGTSFKMTKSSVEFTDYDYVGDKADHAAHWTASDHFFCTLPASGAPECTGEIASGDSMLLIAGTGGQGTFTIPVVGGTGNDIGARGTLKVHDLGTSSKSNLTITLTKT